MVVESAKLGNVTVLRYSKNYRDDFKTEGKKLKCALKENLIDKYQINLMNQITGNILLSKTLSVTLKVTA